MVSFFIFKNNKDDSVNTLKADNRYISRGIKSVVEGLLEDYPKYYNHKEKREFQLANPVGVRDDNVGGGKAQNNYQNPVLGLMITTESDTYLTNLTHNHDVIRVCYEEADPNIKIIIDELYFKDYKKRDSRSIDDLIHKGLLNMSRSSAYDAWNNFIYETAIQLGLGKFLKG